MRKTSGTRGDRSEERNRSNVMNSLGEWGVVEGIIMGVKGLREQDG